MPKPKISTRLMNAINKTRRVLATLPKATADVERQLGRELEWRMEIKEGGADLIILDPEAAGAPTHQITQGGAGIAVIGLGKRGSANDHRVDAPPAVDSPDMANAADHLFKDRVAELEGSNTADELRALRKQYEASGSSKRGLAVLVAAAELGAFAPQPEAGE